MYEHKKKLSKWKIQKQFEEDSIVKNINKFLKLKKGNKTKDGMIRDI